MTATSSMMSTKELGVALGGAIAGAAMAVFMCASGATASGEAFPEAAAQTAADAAVADADVEEPGGRAAALERLLRAPRADADVPCSPSGLDLVLRSPRQSQSDELDLAATPSRIARLANSRDLPIMRPLDIGAGGAKMRRRRPGWERFRRSAESSSAAASPDPPNSADSETAGE